MDSFSIDNTDGYGHVDDSNSTAEHTPTDLYVTNIPWTINQSFNGAIPTVAEQPLIREYETYLSIAIGTLGFIGNGIVIVVFCSSKMVRKMANIRFVVNQSMIDLVSAVLMMASAGERTHSRQYNSGFLGEVWCRLWTSQLLMWSCFTSSTFNLLAITLERYLKIVHPLRHKVSFTPAIGKAICACVWLAGITYNVIMVLPSSGVVNGTCMYMSLWPAPWMPKMWGVLTATVQYFIPIIFMAITYTKMAFVLHRRVAPEAASITEKLREARLLKARKNVVKTFVLVTLLFIICWTGNTLYFFFFNLGLLKYDNAVRTVTVYLAFANCCVNPFIYAFKFETFKKEARKLLLRLHNRNVVHPGNNSFSLEASVVTS